MTNIREQTKRARIKKIRSFIGAAKKDKLKINKEQIIAWLIVEDGVRRRTALEEIEAVLRYDG